MANARYKHVVGMESLTSVLQQLPREVRKTILADGMKALLRPIVTAAKRYATSSVRTGALRASITDKVINYEHSGKCVGLVGPAKGYYNGGKKLGKNASRSGAESPSHYAHLVEMGHYSGASSEKFGGFEKGSALKPSKKITSQRTKQATARSFVRPKPFLRPAVSSTLAAQSAAFYRGVERGIDKVRKAGIKAGTHVV